MGELLDDAARGLCALAQSRWSQAAGALEATLSRHEIIGGSRAQRDLLREAWAFAKGEGRPLPSAFHRPLGAA